MSCVATNAEAIQAAYLDVRDDKTDTDWLLLEFVDKSKELSVAQTGNGGLDELKNHLKSGDLAFAYVRMTIANDELSQRAKFVLIYWGGNASLIRKAKLSFYGAEVKTIITHYAIDRNVDTLEELDTASVVQDLRKAGGANYDRQASDY
ncbi:hypothetical protein THASP1DRAFT_30314 [Thamnocephalis sphaerospora]|uniref:ADF-H domain-containing protein n=1 Tax=Thamnocephalis sphaerospora TaxID=78915 RepID=A0A4P9XPS0_9FUNG|nr:hypothetical protein THASP1DRAFT_30314 [Thamnocephalis sphaerospora]|eukprot:RKP07882.1 hypothetical protein THASP1DRAFT_30314 [Thamnocephalis sphaerospora]